MSYYIVIRGPAGIGKSAVAEKLAVNLKGIHISFDKIMSEHKLDKSGGDGISAENFIKANELVIPVVKKELENNRIVIFDGCFYRKEQLQHLEKSLKHKHYVFSLIGMLDDCLARNKTRKKPMTDNAVKAVFEMVSKVKIGIEIDTSGKSLSWVVKEIMLVITNS